MAEATGTEITNTNTGILSRISGIFSNVKKLRSDPAVQKSVPLAFGIIVTFVGIIAFYLMQKPEMTTLFSSLPENEKSAVFDALKQNGVDVSLNSATGEVIVPVDDYHNAKMLLASQGLPSSVPDGYSSLNDMPMGTSRSVEAVKIKQTLEAELSKSLNFISGISSARVHLAIPEKTVFARETALPSASVFVRLASGRSLGRQQVQSIVHLVSSSVPNLPSENVTVIDQFGELLSKPKTDNNISASEEQIIQQMKLGEIYRSKVISLLTPMIGAGNVKAEVNVDMNFTKKEITEELVDPEGNAIRSEQNTLDESGDAEAQGIPGALANQPPLKPDLKQDSPNAKGGIGNIKSRSQSTVKNYEVSKKIETTLPQVGQVTKIKAAVVIRENKITSEDGTVSFEKVDPKRLEEIKLLVMETLGFDENRGDSITVKSSPFVDTLEPISIPWYESGTFKELSKQLGMILIFAIITFGALLPLLRRVIVPASFSSGAPVISDGDFEEDLDKVEVQEGDTLEDIKAKLKPKKQAISAEMLDTANTYDDKVAVIRMIVGDQAGRVSNVFKNMMKEQPIDN